MTWVMSVYASVVVVSIANESWVSKPLNHSCAYALGRLLDAVTRVACVASSIRCDVHGQPALLGKRPLLSPRALLALMPPPHQAQPVTRLAPYTVLRRHP